MRELHPDSSPNKKTVFVKARKVYARAEKVTVSVPKSPPARTTVNHPLTKQQKDELQEWITEWVATSNLAKKPITYGASRTLLYRDGLAGQVNHVDQIEQSEFDLCLAYIKQRIRILETVGNQRTIRRKSAWRTNRIAGIHTRCKELGVPDEVRKAYQFERFKINSLTDLDDDQLQEMYAYVFSNNPKFSISHLKAPSIQAEREKELSVLLGVLEANANAKGQLFNREKLPYSREDMLGLLFNRNLRLFSNKEGEPISLSQFDSFWKKQKICRLKSGR